MRMYQYKVIKCILHKNKLSLFFFIFVPKVLEKEFMLNQHIGCVIIGPFCFSKIFIFYAGFLYLLKQLDNIRNNYLLWSFSVLNVDKPESRDLLIFFYETCMMLAGRIAAL